MVDIELRMTPTTTKLGTVVVTATRRLTRDELMSHIGYELRRAKGQGKFIDSVELFDYKKAPHRSDSRGPETALRSGDFSLLRG